MNVSSEGRKQLCTQGDDEVKLLHTSDVVKLRRDVGCGLLVYLWLAGKCSENYDIASKADDLDRIITEMWGR